MTDVILEPDYFEETDPEEVERAEADAVQDYLADREVEGI